eukprot:Opistho-1_new@20348
MAKLGRRVDELEVDLLEGRAARVGDERLAERDDALLGAHNAALDHDVVVGHLTVVGEATERRDRLVRQIVLRRGVVLDDLAALRADRITDAVDLLVALRAVEVAVLTGAGHRVLHVGRVPRANARDLAETLVRLAGELARAPALRDAREAVALRHTNDVNHLVLGKDGLDVDLLLEVLDGKVDLVGDRPAVDLDLHDVRLLLELDLARLRVSNDADDRAVLLDAGELAVDRLLALLRRPALGVLGERLLLRLVPRLVEAAAAVLAQVLGPHRRERAEAAGRLDVPDNTDDDHRRRLNDRDGLDDLLLVRLRARAVELAHNVRHAGLVAHEGRQVARLRRIVTREALDLALMARSALAGKEPQVAVARRLKLAVRHCGGVRRTRRCSTTTEKEPMYSALI